MSRRPSLPLGYRAAVAVVTVGVLATIWVAGLLFPESVAGTLSRAVFAAGTVAAALRLSVPITLAALGGIFSEKSGVINIGLEGLLIISAFSSVYGMKLTGSLWMAFGAGVLASSALAALFAVVCIEFRADQIIAGLAVWLIALGLAPFAAQVVYGAPNVSTARTAPTLSDIVGGVPVLGPLQATLSAIPVAGALFDAGVTVYVTILAVAGSWYVLNRTWFGRWVRASGENPDALDTAGVSVTRVRYAAVLLSGVLSGLGGAALAMDLGQFSGNGATMVNGKGFIAIVAYLFGNYNPVGAFLSTLLFTGLQAVQNPLQIANIGVPQQLIRIAPFVMVIVVLALVGRTRIPAAAGEHFESGEE